MAIKRRGFEHAAIGVGEEKSAIAEPGNNGGFVRILPVKEPDRLILLQPKKTLHLAEFFFKGLLYVTTRGAGE